MSYKDEFIEFLKEKRLWSKFKKEFNNGDNIDKYLDYRLLGGKQDSFVIGAFYWEQSEDGRAYWNNIDKQWRRYLNNLKKIV